MRSPSIIFGLFLRVVVRRELDRAVSELHDALQRRPEAVAAPLAMLAARFGT